jgi:hypothetical protein
MAVQEFSVLGQSFKVVMDDFIIKKGGVYAGAGQSIAEIKTIGANTSYITFSNEKQFKLKVTAESGKEYTLVFYVYPVIRITEARRKIRRNKLTGGTIDMGTFEVIDGFTSNNGTVRHGYELFLRYGVQQSVYTQYYKLPEFSPFDEEFIATDIDFKLYKINFTLDTEQMSFIDNFELNATMKSQLEAINKQIREEIKRTQDTASTVKTEAEINEELVKVQKYLLKETPKTYEKYIPEKEKEVKPPSAPITLEWWHWVLILIAFIVVGFLILFYYKPEVFKGIIATIKGA